MAADSDVDEGIFYAGEGVWCDRSKPISIDGSMTYEYEECDPEEVVDALLAEHRKRESKWRELVLCLFRDTRPESTASAYKLYAELGPIDDS